LLTLSAPAFAADAYVCHATGSDKNPYILKTINGNGLNGHDEDSGDIIAPSALLPAGMNWTAAGIAIYNNNCETVTTPPVVVVDPPAEVVDPPAEVVDPPAEVVQPPAEVVQPPAEVVQPPAEVPAVVVPSVVVAPAAQTPVAQAAPAKVPAAAAAPVSQGTNQGYNAQTAVGGNAGDGAPTWLGGLGALLAAGLAVAARRRSRTE
jgi:outer membrane biosynthesis protein TonB